MNKLAPIILFVYNRVEHTKLTIEYLKKNELSRKSDLFIFSDGPKYEKDIKDVKEVREYINSITGFNNIKIFESDNNRGLANSVIDGVSKILEEYDKVIVLEDDLITSNVFLKFMNDCLEYYKDNDKIWSIAGYSLPIMLPKNYNNDIYITFRASSWGWATWKKEWDNIDWNIIDYEEFISKKKSVKRFKRGGNDLPKLLEMQMKGRIDSWAIRWCYNQFKQNKYTIYPCKSLITNIGFDGSGTHCGNGNEYNVNIFNDFTYNLSNNIEENSNILRKTKRYYSDTIERKIKRKIIKFFNFNR